ncbi:MAG: ribonuclease R [Erysipelotrichaceae bacterium]|nr:ribonuclease R [Erysipelotrichaceae bacterium]
MEKEQILKVIRENKKEAYDIKDLALLLNMTTTSEFVKLNKLLNQLVDECLVFQTAKNKFVPAETVKIARGIIRINAKGVGYVDFSEDESIVFDPKDLHGAMHLDEVSYRYDDSHHGKVIKIIHRNYKYVIGTFSANRKGTLFFDADDSKILSRFKILNQKKYHLVDGLKAQVEIVSYGDMIQANIVSIIGHKNDPGVDIKSILMSFDVDYEFTQEVLQEANAISQVVLPQEYQGRRDLRDIYTCTIDGDDAKDFDDAISISKNESGYNLKVSIADVSHYVKEQSAIDKEAFKRGNSTYVLERVVPMLPHVLSNGICSLNPNVDRLAITCDMDLDEQGNVINYQLYPSVINSNHRMTYHQVNQLLDGVEIQEYEDSKHHFILMQELASIIQKVRKNEGAIDFDKQEAEIVLDSKGKVADVRLRIRKDAERMIESFMILANETVATHLRWLEYPCLYRVHELPKEAKLRQFVSFVNILGYKFKGHITNIDSASLQQCLEFFKEKEEYPVVSTLMLRSMTKARYDALPLGHYGLGLENYCHFTSPIRRYADLVVHRSLRKYCFTQDYHDLEAFRLKMEEYGQQTSSCERKSADAEFAVVDLKKCEYMKQHLGQAFKGVISSITKFGMYVELANTIEGLVHVKDLNDDHYSYVESSLMLVGQRTNKTYKLGQQVMVKCVSANLETRTIDFVLVEKRRGNK